MTGREFQYEILNKDYRTTVEQNNNIEQTKQRTANAMLKRLNLTTENNNDEQTKGSH